MEFAEIDTLHPELYHFMLDGLQDGFSIHYDHQQKLLPPGPNLPCGPHEFEVVTRYLEDAMQKGRLLGPFTTASAVEALIHCAPRPSPLGCVFTSEKYRAILDLSSPHNGGTGSVNKNLIDEWCHIHYIPMIERVRIMKSAGPTGRIWVVDASEAYLQLKVKRNDIQFLVCKWQSFYFIFNCMMLGLASAPRVYTLFADTVLRIFIKHLSYSEAFVNEVLMVAHYLDDFFGAHSDPAKAWKQYWTMQWTNTALGIPFKARKAMPPATSQIVLGLLYDLPVQLVKVPREKAKRYRKVIKGILRRGWATKKELRSVVGKLRHVSLAIWGGPAFIRYIEFSLHKLRNDSLIWNLTREAHLDLEWWLTTLNDLSLGTPFDYYLLRDSDAEWHFTSDAAGAPRLGMGGSSTFGEYWQLMYSDLWAHLPDTMDIYFCEFLAVCINICRWHKFIKNSHGQLWCDNKSVVKAFTKFSGSDLRGASRHMLRLIVPRAHKARFTWTMDYISTKENIIADSLSRNAWSPDLDTSAHPASAGVHPMQKKVPKHQLVRWVKFLLQDYYNPQYPPWEAVFAKQREAFFGCKSELAWFKKNHSIPRRYLIGHRKYYKSKQASRHRKH